MPIFRNLSIQTKILSIVWIGIISTLLVALAHFIFSDRTAMLDELESEMRVLVHITAERSRLDLMLGDTVITSQHLADLAINSKIQSACIYNINDKLVANFQREPNSAFNCQLHANDFAMGLGKDRFVISETISNKGTYLGKLIVTTDLSVIKKKFSSWIKLTLYMLITASAIVLLMTKRLHDSIITPIKNLKDTMHKVMHTNDLTLRATQTGNDEISQLSHHFNVMLDMIDNSNGILQTLYSDLVEKTTRAESVAVDMESRESQTKELLSGAVHDLRQPLQAMSIFVDILKDQPMPELQLSLVHKIELSVENLRTMFAEILDASRLDHLGKPEPQLIFLNQMLCKLHHEFSVLAKNKQLDLRIRASDISLFTIPGLLERVIRNLVSNAINYTDKGGILLLARKRKKVISIEVWDTGIGIPAKHLDRIFLKFERAENSRQEKNGNYGLGLALVNNFNKILGYNLAISSRLGKGSCFRIEIPLQQLADSKMHRFLLATQQIDHAPNIDDIHSGTLKRRLTEKAPIQKPTLTHPSLNADFLAQHHAIVIDDNREIRAGIRLLLETWQVTVAEFTGVGDAELYFANSDYLDPDFIISDYQLNDDITGDIVIERIHQYLGINTPALIVTGNASSAIHNEITEKGFSYLLKPIKADTLLLKLHELLES